MTSFIFTELRAKQSPATTSRRRLRHTVTIFGRSLDHLSIISSDKILTKVPTNVDINIAATTPDTASSDWISCSDSKRTGYLRLGPDLYRMLSPC
ncbi:hypothetical protein ACLOJK_026613 [Asimina triloba]